METCPDSETLAAWSEEGLSEEGHALHLVHCVRCRRLLAALKRAQPAPTFLWRWAAAALLLVVLGGWAIHRRAEPPTPAPSIPVAATTPPKMLLPGGQCQGPALVWLGPGSRLRVKEGLLRRPSESRLVMEEGELRIDQLAGAPLELSTPAGTLTGGGMPWRARVRCAGAPALAAWLMREAQAARAPELLVEVQEGEVQLRPPTGEALAVKAGERLRLRAGASPLMERLPVLPPSGLKIWEGAELAALLGQAGALEGGSGKAWALPLVATPAYGVELKVRLLGPESRLALAVPTSSGLRLWQPSGVDLPQEGPHWVRFTVLGQAASGGVDGRRLWAVEDLEKALQSAGEPAGLRVWGRLEVLAFRIRVLEEVTDGW